MTPKSPVTAFVAGVRLLALLWLPLVCSITLNAQVVQIDGDQFVSGRTMHIRYDTHAPEAFHTMADDLYAAVYVNYYDHDEYFSQRMTRTGYVFDLDFMVPKGAAFITMEFVAMARTGNDPKHSITGSVYEANGRPMPGAMMHSAARNPTSALDDALKELELYPTNVAAYRWKWAAQATAKLPALDSIVEADVRMLLAPALPAVDALYAASFGHTMRGRQADAEQTLSAMLERFPNAALTADALRSYEYSMFAKNRWDSISPELTRLKLRTMMQHPSSPLARRNIASALVNYRSRLAELLPIAGIENICHSWIADAPDDPNPYLTLATADIAYNMNLEIASQLLDTAITLYLRNGHRMHMDAFGSMGARQLPEAYRLAADLAQRRGDFGKALAALEAAEKLDMKKGSGIPLQQAQLWQLLGRTDAARKAYTEALQRGATEARDSLRALYVREHGNDSAFEGHLARLQNREPSHTATDRDPAQPFTVQALDGTELTLEDLRGKVVVLNFWFIGCAPCRREMPALNTLVDRYAGRDVVFIALATDDATTLKRFLKKNTFKYRVVPNAASIAAAYRTAAYPTHVVIDRHGLVLASFTGATNTETDLQPLIERALNE